MRPINYRIQSNNKMHGALSTARKEKSLSIGTPGSRR